MRVKVLHLMTPWRHPTLVLGSFTWVKPFSRHYSFNGYVQFVVTYHTRRIPLDYRRGKGPTEEDTTGQITDQNPWPKIGLRPVSDWKTTNTTSIRPSGTVATCVWRTVVDSVTSTVDTVLKTKIPFSQNLLRHFCVFGLKIAWLKTVDP